MRAWICVVVCAKIVYRLSVMKYSLGVIWCREERVKLRKIDGKIRNRKINRLMIYMDFFPAP